MQGMAYFSGEDMVLELAGSTRTVRNISGWRCSHCGEEEFDHDTDSATRYGQAHDSLVFAVRAEERRRQGLEIRRVRKKLRLTQAEAERLTGGGHNAFSRYERGELSPLPAVQNLFKILDRHPELLAEIADQPPL